MLTAALPADVYHELWVIKPLLWVGVHVVSAHRVGALENVDGEARCNGIGQRQALRSNIYSLSPSNGQGVYFLLNTPRVANCQVHRDSHMRAYSPCTRGLHCAYILAPRAWRRTSCIGPLPPWRGVQQ